MKMNKIHGGDIYRNHVQIDFSVNVNPFGIPEAVEKALYEAVKTCSKYPDIHAERLKQEVGKMLKLLEEYLLFGNGASELFLAVIHAIQPKKTVIPVPSFYGYEYAANAVAQEVIYYEMKKENAFCLDEAFFEVLTEDVDLLFLANPNNPTGSLIEQDYLKRLLHYCKKHGIYVVLDECFIEFCTQDVSMLKEIEIFENVMIIRAFTKIYAIPGVRLGYLICSNQMLLEKIKRQLPEWNLSNFAQQAGCACAKEHAFIEQTAVFVGEERKILEDNLKSMGFLVYPSDADFLLLYSEKPLYDRLLEHGILIRNCENFRGLSKGFYRIAVKSRAENEILLKLIGEIQ